eukprot:47854-Eustigmatos_ZCMA.PRE.1
MLGTKAARLGLTGASLAAWPAQVGFDSRPSERFRCTVPCFAATARSHTRAAPKGVGPQKV